jgi:hypothetical protein
MDSIATTTTVKGAVEAKVTVEDRLKLLTTAVEAVVPMYV